MYTHIYVYIFITDILDSLDEYVRSFILILTGRRLLRNWYQQYMLPLQPDTSVKPRLGWLGIKLLAF